MLLLKAVEDMHGLRPQVLPWDWHVGTIHVLHRHIRAGVCLDYNSVMSSRLPKHNQRSFHFGSCRDKLSFGAA